METTKKKVGLYLPIELADTFDQLAQRVGKKQKWLIVGAALVRFLQADESIQNELIRQVKFADLPGGSFENLIATARLGAPVGVTPTGTERVAHFQQLVAVDPAEHDTKFRNSTNQPSSTSSSTMPVLSGSSPAHPTKAELSTNRPSPTRASRAKSTNSSVRSQGKSKTSRSRGGR